MKSIGLSIIMAQCGMFAPCEDMIFRLYDKIFTRIPSGDDLFKGQSTFAVEIAELRNILKRSNENSLVIGDELASGTESVSAVSIVASGIINLIELKSSFVFATHLHDLTGLQKIKDLKELKVYHMSVVYDESLKKLIYNRKLEEGQGNTIYGLEVCRSLDMSEKFLINANEFRRELLDVHQNIINPQTSKYNPEVFMNLCGVCGNKAEDIHHIIPQENADVDGYIGIHHKNEKHNLVSLCKDCHIKLHQGKILIEGYVNTSEGLELLKTVHNDDETPNEKEISEKVIEFRRKNLTYPKIKAELYELFGIHFTIYKIKKIVREFVK